MERNKYNKATRLLKRIDALKGICIIEKIDSFELTFDAGGGCFFCVDKELNSKVQELCKSLKEKLEKEFEEL
jgi:hypothetical protein